MEIICVPAIVAIVYVLMEAYKTFIAKGREKWVSVIPVIAVIIGGILGAVFFYSAPQLIIATNIWVALVIGACSGLSATGTNQIFKQLEKFGVKIKEVEQKDNDE